ncbi:MAG: hypothetical protein WA081_14430 [Desulfosalsimonadaceae bacterium]
MKKLIFILPALYLALACASMPTMPMGQNQALAKDQVHAQNRIMKKNLDLALRENEVLKTENEQYKSHVKELDCTISTLNADMESLTTKYNEDTASLNEEIAELNNSYETLHNDFTLLEQESGQRISELTEQNHGLEKQLAAETTRLNSVIKDQKASFDSQLTAAAKELASTKDGCASRELALQNQLSESKKAAVKKDADIQSLEARHQEALKKTAALEKTLQEQTEKIQKMEKAHQELITSRQDLQKTIKEKQTVIDKLSQKPNPAPAASKPVPKPIETH